jgi:hypothetical protein
MENLPNVKQKELIVGTGVLTLTARCHRTIKRFFESSCSGTCESAMLKVS